MCALHRFAAEEPPRPCIFPERWRRPRAPNRAAPRFFQMPRPATREPGGAPWGSTSSRGILAKGRSNVAGSLSITVDQRASTSDSGRTPGPGQILAPSPPGRRRARLLGRRRAVGRCQQSRRRARCYSLGLWLDGRSNPPGPPSTTRAGRVLPSETAGASHMVWHPMVRRGALVAGHPAPIPSENLGKAPKRRAAFVISPVSRGMAVGCSGWNGKVGLEALPLLLPRPAGTGRLLGHPVHHGCDCRDGPSDPQTLRETRELGLRSC